MTRKMLWGLIDEGNRGDGSYVLDGVEEIMKKGEDSEG